MTFATILIALLFGLAVGSFLNVVISRAPRGESVVNPGSHCRNCGRALRWWENIPVASYLALRGRCRTCGARIGVRYLVVEAAAAVVAAAAAAWVRLAPVMAVGRGLGACGGGQPWPA